MHIWYVETCIPNVNCIRMSLLMISLLFYCSTVVSHLLQPSIYNKVCLTKPFSLSNMVCICVFQWSVSLPVSNTWIQGVIFDSPCFALLSFVKSVDSVLFNPGRTSASRGLWFDTSPFSYLPSVTWLSLCLHSALSLDPSVHNVYDYFTPKRCLLSQTLGEDIIQQLWIFPNTIEELSEN